MNIKTVLRGFAGRRARLVALALATTLSACDTNKILQVTDPDVARPDAFTSASAIPALFAGALGSFGTAVNGSAGDVEQVQLSGSLSDELINTETFPTRIEIDQRTQTITNTSLGPVFLNITRARAAAERAINAYQTLAKTKADSTGYAEALALNGYVYILLAENYCGSVPTSVQNADGTFTFGVGLTTQQLLDSATAKFNQALTKGGSSLTASVKSFVSIGLGRADLDRGSFAAAATDVAGVPTTYQYTYAHSQTSGGQNNGTWLLTVNVARYGVANLKGTNGLPFASDGDVKVLGAAADPRVADSLRAGNHLGFDGSSLQYIQTKYPNRDSPIVIADGVEARLIEAEAALQNSNPAGALTILNALRSNASLLALRGYPTGSLPPLTLQTTPAAQRDQLFKERAYWLFLTSHRLGDMRRLIRDYGLAPESVFPTGIYVHNGGTYGTDVNSPVPQAEQNNPNYVAGSCKQNQA
ncbi:MAG: hypothetical protein ABI311_03910 [Gemmatimonadaceae bacterium]